jgi:hypothetical protein
MTVKEEKQLLEDVAAIKKRLLGDKMDGTPSIIDDVETLKKKVTVPGFFKMLIGLKV